MYIKPAREHFIRPHHSLAHAKPELGIAVYYSDQGRPTAIGFYGKKQRPAFHYSYRDAAHRERSVASWLEQVQKSLAHRAQRKATAAAERAQPHTLQVGDVLVASWGYEQTNIDWYEVIELKGRHYVVLRELKVKTVETGWLRGKSVPLPGEYCGDPLRRRVLPGNSVKLRDWGCYARPASYKQIGTIKLYQARDWTAYA